MRYNWTNINWSYPVEPRYFRPLPRAIALWWLALIDRIGVSHNRIKTGVLLLLAVGMGYLLQAHVRWEIQYLTKPEVSVELAAKILALPDSGRMNIVFDIDNSKYVVSGRSDLLAFMSPSAIETGRLTASRPADVWVVRRLKERSAYQLDPDFDLKRFGAEPVWNSSNGDFELYHARVGGK